MIPSIQEILIKKNPDNFLHANDPFTKALKVINNINEGIIFITDHHDHVIGTISDGDIRRHLQKTDDIKSQKIEDIMMRNPICIHIDTALPIALSTMKRHAINSIAIVDEKNHYLGFISLHHLLQYFSTERIYLTDSNNSDENIQRHIKRYDFASYFIQTGWNILDCACGSGYGSEILSYRAQRVVGVDVSQEAIAYAATHHSKKNITYVNDDLRHLDFTSGSFDAIVSFETIEHISKELCIDYLTKASFWLKPGGTIIVSSPMLRFQNGQPFVTNPYHTNEMHKEELLDMLASIFKNFVVHYYHQKQDKFLPLLNEHTGFLVAIARKES